jgi:L-aminopeptidase/D-esterase-like protein
MRYFHRTSVTPDVVLAEADRFFGGSFAVGASGARTREFTGPLGRASLRVAMEGGHYTRVTIETDQVGESELDKLAKRFLGVVHTRAEPDHELRGAY